MNKFYELDHSTGMIAWPEHELFPEEEVKARAEQIMKALSGLRTCSALALLDRCKDAVMQLRFELE